MRYGWAFPIRIIITITIIVIIIIIIILIIIIITIIESDSNTNWFFSRKINIKLKQSKNMYIKNFENHSWELIIRRPGQWVKIGKN